MNTFGSYRCGCDSGFKMNYTENKCDDVDECLKYPCAKNQRCVNFPGSFDCDCDYGFRKNLRYPKYCSDIDECLEHPGNYYISIFKFVSKYLKLQKT